jgi:hypothetical protein
MHAVPHAAHRVGAHHGVGQGVIGGKEPGVVAHHLRLDSVGGTRAPGGGSSSGSEQNPRAGIGSQSPPMADPPRAARRSAGPLARALLSPSVHRMWRQRGWWRRQDCTKGENRLGTSAVFQL